MLKAFSGFFKVLMILLTILACITYLATCLIPYIDTARYWYISILGLGFPIICGLLVALMFFWLFSRSRLWILTAVVLLLGFQQIGVAFSFHFFHSFQMEKSAGRLRVMQWNVHNWNQIQLKGERRIPGNNQPAMMDFIKKYDADVLCLEEFMESDKPEKLPSNINILKKMGYPYFYFLHDDLEEGYYYAGIGIFSKYPIIDSGHVLVDERTNANPMAFADIKVNDSVIKVIAVHLQSVRFEDSDYNNLSKIKKAEEPSLRGSRTIASKLKAGFQKRYDQSLVVNQYVAESKYPVILCGDFNDVPNSGVYFNVRKNLNDAFLKKGSFIGRTFRFISPTLRIDYIMPSKQWKVEQFKVVHVTYSDHYPLVADLKL